MRRTGLVMLMAAALALGACRAIPGNTPSTPDESLSSSSGPRISSIPRCDEVSLISAPADRYRDSPLYVANEMPVEEIQAWARDKPAFEELWIDRDHLGWITLAFSADADARQAELEEAFPDVGVVAVEVDWTLAELEALQGRVSEELRELEVSSGIMVQQGVVSIGIGVLTAERVAMVEERFGDDRVCIEGIDPAEAPAAGPQQPAGDGWRLLADEAGAGQPYRTGIAFDEPSYERLWRESGVSADRPAVDFQSSVVIWFGAVFGSSCPDLRLDDVVVDHERAIVYAEIVLVDPPSICTADANPRAYLVEFERDRLPSGPFFIQLRAEDPPGGVPEERTIVEVDLSAPGAVARPDQVHPDTTAPEPNVNVSGAVIEPGYEARYRMSVHCGIEWLGELNSIAWQTDVPYRSVDFVPPEWESTVGPDEQIELVLLMELGAAPTITATANGHAVVYRATAEELPGCD